MNLTKELLEKRMEEYRQLKEWALHFVDSYEKPKSLDHMRVVAGVGRWES
jgi:hypothetical protein